jgi:hypothetical protein
MDKNDLAGKRKLKRSPAMTLDGIRATLDEMSFPDWQERLALARREAAEGKGISLEACIAKRKSREGSA